MQVEQTEIEAPYELPEGWKWCKLPDYVSIVTGKKDANYGSPDGKYYFFTCAEIPLRCDGFSFSGESLLLPGNGANVGQVIYYDGDFEVYQRTYVLQKISNNISLKYLYYHILAFWEVYNRDKQYGSATNYIKMGNFLNYIFPLPPTLEEQQRIVNRIETLFAKLDQAKEKAQNVVDTFETRKASILHKAFTGELTKKWRAENGVGENQELELIKKHAEQLSKKDILNINTFQESVEDFILDDGTIWKKCQIGAIGIVTNGSTPSRKEPSYWNGTIPWVSSGEVANNIIEFTNECISEEGFNNSSVKKLPVGTVLIAMIGEGKTRGQSSVLNIEATTNQNIAAIVIDHGRVEPKLLWYWLQKEYKNNREAGNGSGPQALNCQRVRELSFILPTLPEQTEIVRILDAIFEKETKAKEAAEAVLEQIDLLKKSILARAFRGEL